MAIDFEQAKRDLVWAIASPSLLNTDDDCVEPPHALLPGDVDAADLGCFLDQHAKHRVGRYFELLVLYYLQRIRGVEIVAHGHQLRAAGRTLGELDFLFRDEAGRLVHWETAVKFYLRFDGGGLSLPEYIGPNAVDTFERKVSRLFDHQLKLPVTEFGDLGTRRAFVKGRIFYHVSSGDLTDHDERLSVDHLRGQWLYATEVDQFCASSECCVFRLLQKPHWLAEEITGGSSDLLEERDQFADLLCRHFAESSAPVHAAAFGSSEHGQTEHSRLFVVSDAWPVRRPADARNRPSH